MRILETDFSQDSNYRDIKGTYFGYLVQRKDRLSIEKGKIQVVTKKKPTKRQLKDLIFAWKVVKYVKSNAIVIAKNNAVLGIGGGQPSRVGSVKIALNKAKKSTKLSVLASDAFFPQPDSIKAAHRQGVKAIIQPGGSIKDKEIIDVCNRFKIVMVFTQVRHFRH